MFGIRVQGGFTICISCSHTGIISASEVIAVRVCIVSLRSLVMALSKKRKFSGVPDVEEAPYQPKDYKFPKRSFGKNAQTTRSFQPTWFIDHPWIHYDETNDSAFCHVCIQAYHRGCLSSKTAEPRFLFEGYTNWKDAKRSGRGFPGHENSDCHKEAVERTVVLPHALKISESFCPPFMLRKKLQHVTFS